MSKTKRATVYFEPSLHRALRLKAARKPQKVLQVPQPDMDKAAAAMRSAKVKGTVKNMKGTRRRSISP